MQEAGFPPQVKDMVAGWLARARNPASRLEAQLQETEQKLKHLEHEKKEEAKIAEIKQQEQNMKIEQYEKVIMMMANEIKNLQEGKETEIGDEKEAELKEAKEKLEMSESEKTKLASKLEDVEREKNNATEKIDILTKVVESVNKNRKEQKTKTNKKNIKCRDVSKANGCLWGDRCKFNHGEEEGLVKEVDCSYWMKGSCRFSDQVCWNIHNPATKGSKAKEQQNSALAVFQEGRESLGQENEGWEEARSRKNKRRMRATPPEKEIEKEIQINPLNVDGKSTQNCPTDGEAGQQTQTFPRDGEASQQMVLQALQALLRQAGVNL